jgi:hypothetical protein
MTAPDKTGRNGNRRRGARLLFDKTGQNIYNILIYNSMREDIVIYLIL